MLQDVKMRDVNAKVVKAWDVNVRDANTVGCECYGM